MKTNCARLLSVLALSLLPALPGRAQTPINSWTGASDANWSNAANWSLEQVPRAGQAVVLDSTYDTPWTNILLTNGTPWFSSLEISNRVLTVSNWNTFLCATTVTIRSSAVLTIAAPFAAGAMSNRLFISCSNFTLDAGARLDANGKGFLGVQAAGNGPGGGGVSSGWGAGGGHGGPGGSPTAGAPPLGAVNGTALDPNPGSSGGGSTTYGAGGHGGGLIQIEAMGTLTLNGLITANGSFASSYPSGGGSGGGIRLNASRFDPGSSGTIQAVGGGGGSVTDSRGGRGGGGRIVLNYSPEAQIGFSFPPLRLSVSGAVAGASSAAGFGTFYIPDSQFLSSRLLSTNAAIYGVTNWTLPSLEFTNCNWMLGGPGLRMLVTNAFTVGSNGILGLHLENSRLECGRLVLTNGGRLSLYSGPTNGATAAYGALACVTGDVWIGSNSWLYPVSNPTNGGSLCLLAQNLFLTATNGGIDASGRGFAPLKGSGAGVTDGSGYGGGGGYGGKGGKGGNSKPAGGSPYGPTNAPRHPGSGGGGDYGGSPAYGGGLVWIEITNRVVVSGIIRANGAKGVNSGNGGGSGGGIHLLCARFEGTAGSLLEANGGNGQALGGGGGGGRIGVWHGLSSDRLAQARAGNYAKIRVGTNCASFAGTLSVSNGTGYLNGPPDGAEPGTIRFVTSPPQSGSLILIR